MRQRPIPRLEDLAVFRRQLLFEGEDLLVLLAERLAEVEELAARDAAPPLRRRDAPAFGSGRGSSDRTIPKLLEILLEPLGLRLRFLAYAVDFALGVVEPLLERVGESLRFVQLARGGAKLRAHLRELSVFRFCFGVRGREGCGVRGAGSVRRGGCGSTGGHVDGRSLRRGRLRGRDAGRRRRRRLVTSRLQPAERVVGEGIDVRIDRAPVLGHDRDLEHRGAARIGRSVRRYVRALRQRRRGRGRSRRRGRRRGRRARGGCVVLIDHDPAEVARIRGVARRSKGVPAQRNVRVDLAEQLSERDWLANVRLGARPELLVLLERLVARLARHDDERDVFEVRVLLQLVTDREPIHARELDRQQDQVRTLGLSLLQPRVAIVDHPDGAPELS